MVQRVSRHPGGRCPPTPPNEKLIPFIDKCPCAFHFWPYLGPIFGIIFGIILGIIFAIIFCIMFGIILSIILGIIFGIIFGTLLGGSKIMKRGLYENCTHFFLENSLNQGLRSSRQVYPMQFFDPNPILTTRTSETSDFDEFLKKIVKNNFSLFKNYYYRVVGYMA